MVITMSTNRLWETFHNLTDIYSPSLGERQLCDALKTRLDALGAELYEDAAGEQLGGNSGNLYAYISGTGDFAGDDPLLFSSHMDTVEPARGKRAILREDGVITSQGDTILGADDVAGISAILEALTRIQAQGLSHRPVELLFTIAEERHCIGSAIADYDRIRAKEAYVLDLGGAIGEAANAAPTILTFSIDVEGKAAHAGFAPQRGIHAIAVAARAIAQLPLGQVQPGLTCNIGGITGGKADNIVPALCTATGEIRSLSHATVLAHWAHVQSVFEQEAAAVGASVKITHNLMVTAYETPQDSRVVQRYRQACADIDATCTIEPTLGASDNNHFALHGIEGLVIACSMHDVHSTAEWCRLDEMERSTQLVMRLMLHNDNA